MTVTNDRLYVLSPPLVDVGNEITKSDMLVWKRVCHIDKLLNVRFNSAPMHLLTTIALCVLGLLHIAVGALSMIGKIWFSKEMFWFNTGFILRCSDSEERCSAVHP